MEGGIGFMCIPCHTENGTIEEENMEGFTQVKRRSKNNISKISPNKAIQQYYQIRYSYHPMITRRYSKKPQNEMDYFLHPVDERFDSPHKLAATLQQFKVTHPEETIFRPYLRKAIKFHNRFNKSIFASVGIPSKKLIVDVILFLFLLFILFFLFHIFNLNSIVLIILF
ncbi:unnamed protein product [Cuscuta europaea]|uniref:Uncharacterized protein n=1 Tax=Cuscuta europaea TaxID=41803 RepID=A0A9P0ZLG1_CUSEU|nr:unnamed protein product [Cuscuta europaea]